LGVAHILRVFANRVLRAVLILKGRRMHDEKLHDVYCSPIIVVVIKSRRMK
jgi:hypothetical protein